MFERKEFCDAGVEIASRVRGLYSDAGGRGPSLVLTRLGNADEERMEGWMEREEEEEEAWGLHKLSLTHTCLTCYLFHGFLALSTPPFSGALSLHSLGAIQ